MKQIVWSSETRELVSTMYLSGWTEVEIANELDTTKSVIRNKLKELGIFISSNLQSPWTDEELIDRLSMLTNPTASSITNPGVGTYIKRFGSWSNALKLANKSTSSRSYTEEELLDILKNSPIKSYNYFNDKDNNTPSAVTYVRRFGSWANALERAGLPTNEFSLNKNKETHVYLIEFEDTVYKVGITQQSIRSRFSGYPKYEVILTITTSLKEAKDIERVWLDNVKQFKYVPSNFPRNNGATECFKM